VVDVKLDFQTVLKECQKFSPDRSYGSAKAMKDSETQYEQRYKNIGHHSEVNILMKLKIPCDHQTQVVLFLTMSRSQFGEAQINPKKKFKKFSQFGL
jgi:hypothetical protein